MSPNAPLRIVHCFRAPVGGVFRHVRDLIDAQIAAGHIVGVVCDATTGSAFEEQRLADLQPKLALGLQRVEMRRRVGPGDVLAALRTYRLIGKLRPDILHGHGAKGGVYARLFGTWLRWTGNRTARFYSPHGGSLHYDAGKLTGRAIFAIERWIEPMTDRIIFVSGFERATYIRKVGEPRCRSVLIHNGLAERDFEPLPVNDPAADFLFIGEMRYLKGPDIFIDALARAGQASGRRLTGIMVGDGRDRTSLMQSANAGGAAAIEFRLPMAARDAFQLARVVVIPSRAESLPYILLEALAAGRPVIASHVGGIPEILGADSPALIEPNADRLAAKMLELLADPDTFQRHLPDITTLKRSFSVNSMAARMESEYYEALNS